MEVRTEIDRLHLEDEWVRHTDMYAFAVEQVSDAQADYDEAKNKLAYTEAKVDAEIRSNPAEYGWGTGKPTEKWFANTVLLDPIYRKAQAEVVEARRQFNRAKGVVDTLEHRKRALSNLVDLWVREYYSELTPKRNVPQDNESTMTEQERFALRRRAARRRRATEESDGEA